MLRRDVDQVVGTHIEVGGVVTCQQHRSVGAHELHFAVVAGHSPLGGLGGLEGYVRENRIGNLAGCRRLPFQEIRLARLYDIRRPEVQRNHTCFGIVARRYGIVGLLGRIHLVQDGTVQRCGTDGFADDVEGQTNGVPHVVLI